MSTYSPKTKHHRKWSTKHDDPGIEFGSDYDRILYSTAFRRLGGVTQVVGPHEIALFHNRLTHTLKTAQVGSRIAKRLKDTCGERRELVDVIERYGGLEPKVVRAACMAHDLGHPPFGHIAEQELQILTSDKPNRSPRRREPEKNGRPANVVDRHPKVQEDYELPDRFEGNAQSFRIVTKLAFREPSSRPEECPALDLTRGVLAAMLKYPWSYRNRPDSLIDSQEIMKWGYYESERIFARWIFEGTEAPAVRPSGIPGRPDEYRTLEAQVMDWADDISYAIHDVEDFYRGGVIPLDLLARSDTEWDAFFEYSWKRNVQSFFPGDRDQVYEWMREVRFKYFPKEPYEGSRQDREALHDFASNLIKEATDVATIDQNGVVSSTPEHLARIEVLKNLTWFYVIDRPELESVQRGQRYLIRSLYRDLIEWIEQVWRGPDERSTPRELPARLLEYLDIAFSPHEWVGYRPYDSKARIARAVVDYIVSLTEIQAFELHARLTGHSAKSILDNWLHL